MTPSPDDQRLALPPANPAPGPGPAERGPGDLPPTGRPRAEAPPLRLPVPPPVTPSGQGPEGLPAPPAERKPVPPGERDPVGLPPAEPRPGIAPPGGPALAEAPPHTLPPAPAERGSGHLPTGTAPAPAEPRSGVVLPLGERGPVSLPPGGLAPQTLPTPPPAPAEQGHWPTGTAPAEPRPGIAPPGERELLGLPPNASARAEAPLHTLPTPPPAPAEQGHWPTGTGPAEPRPGVVPPGERGPVGLPPGGLAPHALPTLPPAPAPAPAEARSGVVSPGGRELVGAGARVVVRAGQTAPLRPAGRPAGARPIEGLLLGLAAGDAAGWPAARHRASRMPEWTRRLTRELDTFAEQNATTTLPVPIALNQPPEPLRLGPSDDAEWAAFVAESVLTAAGVLLSDLSRSRRMRAAIDLAWNALASEVAAAAERAPEVESAVLPLRARISVRAGLGNLATGLRPPATGHDNPHYFDDAACIRACVLAVVHPGDARAAADLAEFDARYTQDGDGVHGARAMAAAIATALSATGATGAGDAVDAAVDAALAQLPEATEIGRNARHAVRLARTHKDGGAFGIVPTLEHEIVDHVYSYGIAAAETVPVALALATAARGRMAEAVPAAACLSRVADSAPALAGALTGVIGGGDSIPAAWREACRTLSGCALPRLAGTDLVELAALLAATELTSPKG
ncbi:ADP-ribosylglycohydrolase family protein [Streptomyces sp. NPDC056544]|uniref:ADP-ribosylglycohydrolase family protein n=1 Tax=unclassified Streptomyces TaxID=2593676 RepID=UPI0036B55C86